MSSPMQVDSSGYLPPFLLGGNPSVRYMHPNPTFSSNYIQHTVSSNLNLNLNFLDYVPFSPLSHPDKWLGEEWGTEHRWDLHQ